MIIGNLSGIIGNLEELQKIMGNLALWLLGLFLPTCIRLLEYGCHNHQNLKK